jgi:hypothetical protein
MRAARMMSGGVKWRKRVDKACPECLFNES